MLELVFHAFNEGPGHDHWSAESSHIAVHEGLGVHEDEVVVGEVADALVKFFDQRAAFAGHDLVLHLCGD